MLIHSITRDRKLFLASVLGVVVTVFLRRFRHYYWWIIGGGGSSECVFDWLKTASPTTTTKLYSIDVDRNLLFVVGPVPGPAGGFLRITDALKKDLPAVRRLDS